MITGAAVWISFALLISGLVLSAIFRSIVLSHFDHELQDHARELAGLIDDDAKPPMTRNLSDLRFIPARSGLYWQIHLADGAIVRSPSLDANLTLPPAPGPETDNPHSVDGPTGPMRMIGRLVRSSRTNEQIELRIGADERLVSEEMQILHLALATSLGLMALGMVGTAYAQVSYGLQPLAKIRAAVAAVRPGTTRHLPEDLPDEVMPLVTELNDMINANLSMVERARVLAGNFAHALKTPLAILNEEAAELKQRGQHETAQSLLKQCSRINLMIDYQTARARASALANAGASSSLSDVLKDLIQAYSRLNAGRNKRLDSEGPSDIVVACDPHDLTELLGNLLDNAAKWARERVIVSITDQGRTVQILVEDDGPGIPEQDRHRVFDIGVRLDEGKPGTGLGLAIARDLVTLYDGRLSIAQSHLGGAAMALTLNKRSHPA